MMIHKKIAHGPRLVCHLVLGREHPLCYRLAAGTVVMVSGVLLAKGVAAAGILHYVFDVLGYFLHGIGAVPWVQYLLEDE